MEQIGVQDALHIWAGVLNGADEAKAWVEWHLGGFAREDGGVACGGG